MLGSQESGRESVRSYESLGGPWERWEELGRAWEDPERAWKEIRIIWEILEGAWESLGGTWESLGGAWETRAGANRDFEKIWASIRFQLERPGFSQLPPFSCGEPTTQNIAFTL